MKKILFAHQSTIPHYRAEFYNTLQKLKPDDWTFSVVLDKNNQKRTRFFAEELQIDNFDFDINYTNTYFLSSRKKNICIQDFIFDINKYDLLVLEDSFKNLSYPLCYYLKKSKVKIAFWGHGRDNKPAAQNSKFKIYLEKYKRHLIRKSDLFFAYTNIVKEYLISKGIEEEKIKTINNTIDIEKSRSLFLKKIKNRKHYSLTKKLIFTGRLTNSKRIDFLLDSFKILNRMDPLFELIIIGSGSEKYLKLIKEYQQYSNIKYLGSIIDESIITEIYSEGDFYVYPGYVGLGPLHALTCNLIPIVLQSKHHKPEYDYLNDINAIILEENISTVDYAKSIINLYSESEKIIQMKKNAWASISQLTLDNMAKNFIEGINKILFT